jgi:hypothetical protein
MVENGLAEVEEACSDERQIASYVQSTSYARSDVIVRNGTNSLPKFWNKQLMTGEIHLQ